jgi:hypothetical protein
MSEDGYARLQAAAKVGELGRAGWDLLFAEARLRGEYPPLVCKMRPVAERPELEAEAGP